MHILSCGFPYVQYLAQHTRQIKNVKCGHTCTFPHACQYSTVFCAQMLVNTTLHQTIAYNCYNCVQTFRHNDPCPQKTKHSRRQTHTLSLSLSLSNAISAVLYVRLLGHFAKTILYISIVINVSELATLYSTMYVV